MADQGLATYISTLEQTLAARKEWLEKTELVKLKDELRIYQVSYASLYNIYLKKKIIDEDPYKQDTKINEIEAPSSDPIPENRKTEQISIRLSNFDNQLDYLVNFYQLSVDFLNLDRIKRIVGLIRYIDWVGLTPDSQSQMTKTVSEMTTHSKVGVDQLTLSIIGESLTKLSKTTASAMAILKDLNIYYREVYKLSVRQNVTKDMSQGEANIDNIRKKVHSGMPGAPFYKELVEEIIKEDYSSSSMDLRDTVLNALRVVESKQTKAKAVVNFKAILLDGIVVIGGASTSLNEILAKLQENQAVMESRKKSFFETIKELIRQITNAEPEEVIYNVESMDQTKGIPVKEKVNFHQLMDELEKKNKILASFVRGPAYNKLSAMTEEQIIGYLEKNVKDVQTYHRILTSLDDFFKANVQPEDRNKIKGIKPELSALKNTYIKANQLKYEYSAQMEAEEQMKRLGAAAAPPAAAPAAPAGAPPIAPPTSTNS
jgi:glutamine amidotransferase PdxT